MKIFRFLLLFIVLLFSVGMGQSAIAVVYMNCATQSYIPYLECNALVALYISTNGSSWDNSSGWLNYSDPCTSWYGVNCTGLSDGNHVFELYLNDNNLRGSIPPEIGNLTALSLLQLFDNRLTGFIPDEIGNLTHLKWVLLFENQLSGSIPAEIGNLATLKRLILSDNQLSGSIPPEIGSLTNLDWLGLSRNQLSGSIPLGFGNLTKLEILAIDNNLLCGKIPTNLTNLTNLYNDYGINIKNNYLYTNDAALDAFLILKGGEWESSQGARCPADTEKTILYQIIMGASLE